MGSTVPVLIDLDVPAPVRQPPPERAWRWQLLGAVALLLALGGAASPAVGPVDLTQVTTTGGRAAWTHLLTEDALYTTHFVSDSESEVRAWPVRPGGPRWMTRVPGEDPRLVLHGPTLIADAGYGGGLTMLDAGSGRERWRVQAGDANVLLGDRVAYWSVGMDDAQGVLRVAEVATGRTIWSRSASVGTLYAAAGSLVALDFDYRATVYAAATGRVQVARRDLGIDEVLWGTQAPEAFMALAAVGDQLYLYGPAAVTAFRAADLTRRWRTELEMPLHVLGCGAAICVPAPESLTVLDPATGAVRWRSSRFRTLTAAGFASGWDGRSALVDPATGRIRRELGQGIAAGDLVLRPYQDRTVVTGLAGGGVVGFLPVTAPARCSAAGPYLACSKAGRAYTVWRVTTARRP